MAHLRNSLRHFRNGLAQIVPRGILKTLENFAGVGVLACAFVNSINRVGSDYPRVRVNHDGIAAAVKVIDDIAEPAESAAGRQNVNVIMHIKEGVDANRIDGVGAKVGNRGMLLDDFFQKHFLFLEPREKFSEIFIGRDFDNLRAESETSAERL